MIDLKKHLKDNLNRLHLSGRYPRTQAQWDFFFHVSFSCDVKSQGQYVASAYVRGLIQFL
jgi:hypothetical protein